jgi:hypothetical protein
MIKEYKVRIFMLLNYNLVFSKKQYPAWLSDSLHFRRPLVITLISGSVVQRNREITEKSECLLHHISERNRMTSACGEKQWRRILNCKKAWSAMCRERRYAFAWGQQNNTQVSALHGTVRENYICEPTLTDALQLPQWVGFNKQDNNKSYKRFLSASARSG